MTNSPSFPKHIAIILDGNNRWAKNNNKPTASGHKKGVETLEKILDYAAEIDIKIVTLYAFSSENWKRSENEKSILFNLLIEFFTKKITKILKKNTKLKIIGDTTRFSPKIQKILKESEERSKNNTGCIIQIGLSYGGRDEIIRAIKKYAKDLKSRDKLTLETIDTLDENMFKSYLDTNENSEPDLLIRTGGDFRVSNFLLYQIAYTEFYFTDTLWPDFTTKELDKAINIFKKTERRFGGR